MPVAAKPLPTQQRLHQLFDYSVVTGQLWRRYKSGAQVAGGHNKGYLSVFVDGVPYQAHRLIWRWVTGDDCGALQVNHIDCVRDNNAWHNLELVTHQQNSQRSTFHKDSPLLSVSRVLTPEGRARKRVTDKQYREGDAYRERERERSRRRRQQMTPEQREHQRATNRQYRDSDAYRARERERSRRRRRRDSASD